jgi:hypothetical protein
MDTEKGQNGSPVFYQQDDEYRVVGVHVLGDEEEKITQATLITKERIENIRQHSLSHNECVRATISGQEQECHKQIKNPEKYREHCLERKLLEAWRRSPRL